MLAYLFGCVTYSVPASAPVTASEYRVDPTFNGVAAISGADVRYYDVVGTTDIELLGEIVRRGPKVRGEVRGAATSGTVAWDTLGDGVHCPTVNVSTTITVVFPRWEAPPTAPWQSVGNWQRFVRALAVHEQGHVDIIREFVAAMPEQLSGDCAGVDARGASALAAIDQAGVRYDGATESGGTQGALLFAPRR